MKNILFITTNLDYGGSERRCTTLSLEFCKRGYTVTVLCLMQESKSYFRDLLERGGAKVITAPKIGFLRMIMYVKRLIRNNAFDAVISILYYPNLINCVAAIGNHPWKAIVGEPSSFSQAQKDEGWLFWMKSKIMMRFYKYANSIVCNSYSAQYSMEKYYSKYKGKIKTIYNPITIPLLHSTYIPKKDNKLHICVAASIKKVKNPINVAKAIALMDDNEKDSIVLEWYGSNQSEELYGYLKQFIITNHIENSFVLHPATEDIAEKMNLSDCVGLFSVSEGLPNVICEGLVMGKPILMSKCSDYYNLVGGNGLLCCWNDPGSIKNSIIEMSRKTEAELEIMRSKSFDIASQYLDKTTIINQWFDIINK